MNTIENNWAKLAIIGVIVCVCITSALILNNQNITNSTAYVIITIMLIISCGWVGYCAKNSHEVDVLNTKIKNKK